MAKFGFDAYNDISAGTGRNNDHSEDYKVTFFTLKNDGDEAIVRFAYTSPEQFDIISGHRVKTDDGRTKFVSCLRNPNDPVGKCPICANGEKLTMKFFVKMLVYTQNADGTWSYSARLWERPASFAKLLFGYFSDYGDLSKIVFKVKRHGDHGSLDTTYDVIYANPKVYNSDIMPVDFSAFSDLKLEGYAYITRTYEELQEYVKTGVLASNKKNGTYQNRIPEATANATPNVSYAPATNPAPRAYATGEAEKNAVLTETIKPGANVPVRVAETPVTNTTTIAPKSVATGIATARIRPLRSEPAETTEDTTQPERPRRSYTY